MVVSPSRCCPLAKQCNLIIFILTTGSKSKNRKAVQKIHKLFFQIGNQTIKCRGRELQCTFTFFPICPPKIHLWIGLRLLKYCSAPHYSLFHYDHHQQRENHFRNFAFACIWIRQEQTRPEWERCALRWRCRRLPFSLSNKLSKFYVWIFYSWKKYYCIFVLLSVKLDVDVGVEADAPLNSQFNSLVNSAPASSHHRQIISNHLLCQLRCDRYY